MKNKFEILAERARSETVPRVDVAGRVIAIITAEQDQLDRITERPLMWLAVFSSAVAASVAVISVVSYYLWTSPLVEISETISWVTR
jgi:hypothetical protein